MRLYYLTAEIWAEKVVRERRLKISLFDELNDPFELLAHHLPTRDHRRVASILRQHFASQRGVICFSDSWKNPVMWAHYGRKHYGVCLGFDVSDKLVSPISYEPERLTFDIDLTDPRAGLSAETVKKMLLTKFDAWRYENEYRVMAELREQEPDGNYYANFDETLKLREVILGVRCELTTGDVASWIGGLSNPVEIKKARLAFQKFEVVEQLAQPVVVAGTVC